MPPCVFLFMMTCICSTSALNSIRCWPTLCHVNTSGGEKNLEPVSYLWWAFNSTNYSMIVKKKKKKMRDWPSPSQSALHRAGALKVCALLDQLHQHHWGLGRNADLKLHTKHTESETLRGAQSSTVCGVTSPSGDSDEQSNVRTSWQRNIYWLIVLVISW